MGTALSERAGTILHQSRPAHDRRDTDQQPVAFRVGEPQILARHEVDGLWLPFVDGDIRRVEVGAVEVIANRIQTT